MANGDVTQVPVQGPDGKQYMFPQGTDKDAAIGYFKKKGIGAAPAQPSPAGGTTPKEPAAPSFTGGQPSGVPSPSAATQPSVAPKAQKDPTMFQSMGTDMEGVQSSIQRWRPRWDDPKQLLQDPTWYGRSAKFLGGEAIGAGKAGAGMLTGATKMLNDLIASIDPVELYQRPSGEPGAQFGKDIVDVGRGMVDVGKAAYDLIRHFPEASSDPEHLGSTVMNMAMTVDGGVKGAKALTEHHGFSSPTEAVHGTQDAALAAVQGTKQAVNDALTTAHKVTKSTVDGLLHQKAIEDAFIHKNGVGIAKDIKAAVSEAGKEVKTHVDNLSQIDTKIPSGVIDASKEADVIKNAFADIVKTPDPLKPALNEMLKDAQKTAPGQWTFEKTRQFRSKLGRALRNMEGPQYAVGSRVYADLTSKLRSTAKKFGLEDSWSHYNELERKLNKSFGIIDTAHTIVDENGEGAKMATALKDKAVANEVINSLEKYGLDRDKVLKYSARAGQALRDRMGFNKSMFRQVYGYPGGLVGLPVSYAASSAGMGHLAGMGVGSLAGLGATYLIHAIRAGRLSADLLDGILEEREWPGKLKPPKGSFPEGETPEAAAASPAKGSPPQVPSAPQVPAPAAPVTGSSTQAAVMPHPAEAYGVSKAGVEAYRAGQASAASKVTIPSTEDLYNAMISKGLDNRFAEQRATELIDAANGEKGFTGAERRAAPQLIEHYMGPERRGASREAPASAKAAEVPITKAAPEAVGTEPGKRPGTTKQSAAGRATKQRERVAAKRKEKGSTALGGGTQEISGGGAADELLKAQERANSPHVSVENIQIPEMEEALAKMSPKDFKLLQTLRRKKAISDADYGEGLKHFLIMAYEDKTKGSSEE